LLFILLTCSLRFCLCFSFSACYGDHKQVFHERTKANPARVLLTVEHKDDGTVASHENQTDGIHVTVGCLNRKCWWWLSCDSACREPFFSRLLFSSPCLCLTSSLPSLSSVLSVTCSKPLIRFWSQW
jgi:hypothetical protein